MINESGTMSGGGGRPRGGRMCLGSQAPRAVDASTAAAELEQATQDLALRQQVRHSPIQVAPLHSGRDEQKAANDPRREYTHTQTWYFLQILGGPCCTCQHLIGSSSSQQASAAAELEQATQNLAARQHVPHRDLTRPHQSSA